MATKVKTKRGSKSKGAAFERELADYLTMHIQRPVRRALLSGGGRNEGGSDLEGTPLLHVEAKRTERLNVRAALEQATRAVTKSGKAEYPVVITRQNHMATGDSLVILRLEDFIGFYLAAIREVDRLVEEHQAKRPT